MEDDILIEITDEAQTIINQITNSFCEEDVIKNNILKLIDTDTYKYIYKIILDYSSGFSVRILTKTFSLFDCKKTVQEFEDIKEILNVWNSEDHSKIHPSNGDILLLNDCVVYFNENSNDSKICSVYLKKTWGQHIFTEHEIEELKKGNYITFDYTTGTVKGRLEYYVFENWNICGFHGKFSKTDDNIQVEYYKGIYKPTGKEIRFKKVWSNHKFTEEEAKKLLNGDYISFKAYSTKKQKDYTAIGNLIEKEYNGHKYWQFNLDYSHKGV